MVSTELSAANERVQMACRHAAETEEGHSIELEFAKDCTEAQIAAGAADRARVLELEAELERAKGREEGLHYALQRAYGCKCMQL